MWWRNFLGLLMGAGGAENAGMLEARRMLVGMVFALSVGIGLPGGAGRAQGQTLPANTLSDYTTRVWKNTDGLPEEIVQAFAQTGDGYLWIGTSGGLLRFDGARFTEYTQDKVPALGENSIFCEMTSRDGALWIGTEGGGLVRLVGGNFRRFTTADGLTDGFVRSVVQDRGGAIWVGTDNGLFKLASAAAERVERVDGGDGLAAIAVHAIAEGRQGRMWVGGSRLLTLGEGGQEYTLPGLNSETRVKSILETRDGTVWVGTVLGLQRMRVGETAFKPVPGIAGTVRVLRETSDGTLWIGTIGRGAFTYRAGVMSRALPYSPAPSNTVLSIFEDTDRNIWMGTEAGVVRLSATPVRLVPLNDASDFETISADTDGTMWVASTQLYHLVHGVATPHVFAPLQGARVRNVFRDARGLLWVGTDGRGLAELDHAGSGLLKVFTVANGLSNNFIRQVMQARNGDVWVATDEGINRIRDGVVKKFEMSDGLAYFSVRAMVEDSAGGLWVGTDRGLSHLRGEQFVEDAATRMLRDEKVWAIFEQRGEKGGVLWFGTRSHGLFRMKDGAMAHFTTVDGLESDSVYSILEDAGGRFWISSPNGVSMLRPGDLSAVRGPGARPGARQISQTFYSMSNAGDISPLYGGTQPAGVMLADGTAWFPTNKGPVEIRAAAKGAVRAAGAVRRLVIDQVVVDGKKLAGDADVSLPANNSNLEISYAPMMLGSQDDLRFAYRLEGFDGEWHYASSRRVAYYTNLPAGRYKFVVKVFARGEPGSEVLAAVGIRKAQYFYRTSWFIFLCIAAIALGIWSVHRLKLRRTHAAFDAVLEERARLAREMHDTLIQGCAGVSVLLEACVSAEGEHNSEQQLELIGYARTQLATSIDEARQAVWNLRAESTDDFGTALDELARRTSHESGVPVDCLVEGVRFPFQQVALHEIMMMSREAVYNALLHAKPTKVRLKVRYGSKELALEIADDGCGFDPGNVDRGHYGLIGIGERVRQLGGTLQVHSVATEGTEMQIVVPRECVDGTGLRETGMRETGMRETGVRA